MERAPRPPAPPFQPPSRGRSASRASINGRNRIRVIGAVLTSAELGAAKPAAACFTTACRRLGVTPAGTAHVGDWLEVDALAAARAGLTGIWFDRGVHPATGEPTSHADLRDPAVTRIDTLAGLRELL